MSNVTFIVKNLINAIKNCIFYIHFWGLVFFNFFLITDILYGDGPLLSVNKS